MNTQQPANAYTRDEAFCPSCGFLQPFPSVQPDETQAAYMKRMAVAHTTTCYNSACKAVFWVCYFRPMGGA